MKLLKTTTEIKKAITSIANRGKKLDHDIHVAGVSCLAHIVEHGDTTVLDSLVTALPKGTRKTAFVAWAVEFGTVRLLDKSVPNEATAIQNGRVFALDKSKEFQQEESIAQVWTTFKPEQDIHKAFDLGSQSARLVKEYTKAVKGNAEVKGTDEAIKSLKALLQSLETQGVEL